MTRVLITGSRGWTDVTAIKFVFARLLDAYGTDVTIVSGACPTGADAICERLASQVGWKVERHPADWATHDKAAGFIRNREMVESGVDLCIAFIKNKSKGATHTADLAENAGIETWRHVQ